MISQDISAYESTNIYEYDNSIMARYYPKRIGELLEAAGGTRTESCLELGIGYGYTAEIFSGIFKRYVVLDGDKKMIQRFREKFPNVKVEIIETYFESWESEERFDVIVLGFVVEHVDDPVAILMKYKKFLRKDGRMFITAPNAEALNRRIGVKAGILSDITQLSDNDIRFGHKRYYTIQSLRKDISRAGLSIKKEEGIFLKVMTTKQMIDLKLGSNIINGFLEMGKEYPELSLGLLIEVGIGD